jgi:rsbT antagonist protein RsbS
MARSSIPILRVMGYLLTTIHVDLHDRVADAFQEELLLVIEKTGAPGVVIDISGLEEVDTYVARVLADTVSMAKLMGTRSVLVGMRAEVAATLVRMGYVMSSIETAMDVDDGLALLAGRPLLPPSPAA